MTAVPPEQVEWAMVEACLRGGSGGSPTAVVIDDDDDGTAGGRSKDPADDATLARIPGRAGSSHVVVVDSHGQGIPELRFFTEEGELPGCGHGTVAAIAVLATTGSAAGFHGRLRIPGRTVEAAGEIRSGAGGDVVEAWFDQGAVRLRVAGADEKDAFLAALGLAADLLHPDDDVVVASPGRERLLIPVADRDVLAGVRPDQDQLAMQSRRFDQLGCFVYVPPSVGRPAAARMFAPGIGVPEDVANANSSGCLAAHLLLTGRSPTVAVDQGDALGRPSTVHAAARRDGDAVVTRVGGAARVVGPVRGGGGTLSA